MKFNPGGIKCRKIDLHSAKVSITLKSLHKKMETKLQLEILPQPNDTTCGPTCLHAIYRYYNDPISLSQVIREASNLKTGGTLAVFLACHALQRGYSAKIYTYNLHVFDPSWFSEENLPDHIYKRLQAQAKAKNNKRLRIATQGYLNFLQLGGELEFEDLTVSLIRKYLKKSIPILTGLSSTYLYRSVREYGTQGIDDDIKGRPTGHFVVLCGYDMTTRTVLVADPYLLNPVAGNHFYDIGIDRVIGAILLGVLTHDANFLIIQPKKPK